MVVLAYMVGNDLNDNMNYKGKINLSVPSESIPYRILYWTKSFFKAHSHTYWWIRQKTIYNPSMLRLFDWINVLKMVRL